MQRLFMKSLRESVLACTFLLLIMLVSKTAALCMSTLAGKHVRLQNELATVGTGKMKAFGQSMLPMLKSSVTLTFEKRDDYNVNDIVFCKVGGRFIDAHKITKEDPSKGWLISNNQGWDNGWTRTIYGKVIEGELKGEVIYKSK